MWTVRVYGYGTRKQTLDYFRHRNEDAARYVADYLRRNMVDSQVPLASRVALVAPGSTLAIPLQ